MYGRSNNAQPIPYADPLRAGRHPFQTFMLALLVVSGVPILFGEPTAGSVYDALPSFVFYIWGGSLVSGSSVALIGSYYPKARYATGLALEQIGLGVTGFATLIYACILIVTAFRVGFGGITATGILLGLGAACLRRAYDINLILSRAIDMGSKGTDDRGGVSREGESSIETEFRTDQERP